MEYRIIKESFSEIASFEEIDKFEKAQLKDLRDKYALEMNSSELFDMCMYFEILAEIQRNELAELHYAQETGENVRGGQIATQRQKLARSLTASRFWARVLQERIDGVGDKLNIVDSVKKLIKLTVAEDKYEGTRSKKIGKIKEEKQNLINRVNEVIKGREPGEE